MTTRWKDDKICDEESSNKRAAFQLFIAADYRDRVLDSGEWPDSMILSSFQSGTFNNSGNDDKRSGTDSTSTTAALSQQQLQQSSLARCQSESLAAAAATSATSATPSATSCVMTAQCWPHCWTTMMAANNCDLLFRLAKDSVAFR